MLGDLLHPKRITERAENAIQCAREVRREVIDKVKAMAATPLGLK